ncbi:hypothetical protein MRX96_003523 [Rhipicephalus microplus]
MYLAGRSSHFYIVPPSPVLVTDFFFSPRLKPAGIIGWAPIVFSKGQRQRKHAVISSVLSVITTAGVAATQSQLRASAACEARCNFIGTPRRPGGQRQSRRVSMAAAAPS